MCTALADEVGRSSRIACCADLAAAMTKLGQVLWVGGFIIGRDRVSGTSPFKFGSDSTVGLATVSQVGGQLLTGVNVLLRLDNRYAAMALIRQLVEVEYLAWAFAEDQPEAATWLRSTREERRKMWQPGHLRDRSKGLFGQEDYRQHCEHGGHPTPDAITLLPGHSRCTPADLCWLEAALHGTSIWHYLTSAARKHGYETVLTDLPEAETADMSIARWQVADPTRGLWLTGRAPNSRD
jgi:hypothetical protein